MAKQTIIFCRKNFYREIVLLTIISLFSVAILIIFSDVLSEFWYAWTMMFCLIVVYPLYLEMWYYTYDKNTIIVIDMSHKQLHYSRNGKCEVICFEEILTIDKYSSYSKTATLYYSKILTKNHPPLVITSYLMKDIYTALKNVKPEIPQDDFGTFLPIPPRDFKINEINDI